MKLFHKIAAGIAMLGASTAALAVPYSGDGSDRYLTIKNRSDYQVYHVYYAPEGASSYYTRDLLSDRVINPEGDYRVLVDDGSGRCWFWIKAVTRSGENYWQRKINVCDTGSYTLNN